MPLTKGTKLGTYEVTAGIGAAGMGEVYQAPDTKLGNGPTLTRIPAQELETLVISQIHLLFRSTDIRPNGHSRERRYCRTSSQHSQELAHP